MSAPYGQQPYGYGQPQMPMPNQYGQPYTPGYQYQQPYQQSYQPQPTYQQPPPDNKPTKVDMTNADDFKKSKIEFNEKPKYQDLWATFVFLATVAVTVFLGIWTIPHVNENLDNFASSNTVSSNSSGTYTSTSHKYGHYKRDSKDVSLTTIIIVIASSFIASVAVTAIYFMLVQKFTGKMIKGTFILSIILNIIYAVISVLINPILGLIMLVFAFLYVLCYFFWRSRIPFAKVVLKTVTSVTKKYPATILLGIIECILTSIWLVFVCVTFFAAIAQFRSSNENNRINSDAVGYVIYVFLIFSLYFTSQVINNVVHVTIAGVFATYYFRGVHEPGTNKIEVDVKNPTIKSFNRAITTSFGSICFGSLLIAIVSTLRVLANQTKNEAAEDDNYLLCLIACCVECILSCIEDGIEYFNVYAFTEVAIYGKSYCQAAKDTWTLCKARGIEAIINDNIIGNVLGIGAIAVGSLTAVVTCFVAKVFSLGLLDNGKLSNEVIIIFGLIGFIIGCLSFSVVAQVINSGVATTFVCLCEDPDALRQTKPELWEKVRDTYPSIVY